ncbi:MAG TPA: hypothetical protein VFE27_24400 [Acidobacteriaceae bacterium]|jgi:hypothetical protein|nr:hypothetical protein [Acidobacteriaceae bacterium]
MKSELELLLRWKCHKIVRAAKILEVKLSPSVMDPAEMQYAMLALEAKGTPIFIGVNAGWLERFDPKAGGYLVVYEDGYQSFSSAKAFEDGYALLMPDEAITVNFKKVILTPDGQMKQLEVAQHPEGYVALTKEQATSLAREIMRRFA